MQDQACGKMARVDSDGQHEAKGGQKNDAKQSPRPLRERTDGRRCSSSVAGGRHMAGGGRWG